MEERDIVCAEPFIEDVDEDMSEDADPSLLSVDTSKELLEDAMLRTYIEVMRDTSNRDRVKAASDVAEILGKKGKKAVTIVNADNAQINQQSLLSEDMRNHLLGASVGLKSLTHATDAGITIKEGGRGS